MCTTLVPSAYTTSMGQEERPQTRYWTQDSYALRMQSLPQRDSDIGIGTCLHDLRIMSTPDLVFGFSLTSFS